MDTLAQACNFVPLIVGGLSAFGGLCWGAGKLFQRGRWSAVDAACDATDLGRWEHHFLRSEINAAMARFAMRQAKRRVSSLGRDSFSISGAI